MCATTSQSFSDNELKVKVSSLFLRVRSEADDTVSCYELNFKEILKHFFVEDMEIFIVALLEYLQPQNLGTFLVKSDNNSPYAVWVNFEPFD